MKNIDWLGVFLFGAIVLAAIMGFAIIWRIFSINSAAAKYIPLHKCVVVAYAGQDAEPIYQCDTGLKRKRDM